MALTNHSIDILVKVEKGKYSYGESDFEEVNALNNDGLLVFRTGEHDEPYYKDFSLTRSGVAILESRQQIKAMRRVDWFRWIITSTIAVAALVISIIKL